MDEFDRVDRQQEKLEQILWEENPNDRLYAYWIDSGRRIKPAIIRGAIPFRDLFPFLQSEYGAQSYFLMIRRSKIMIFSGEIHVGVPLVFTPQKDIRLEIERLRRAERKKIRASA